MRKRLFSLLAAAAVAAAGLVATTAVATPAPASAASCHEWSGTLSRDDRGSDVKELQIRVAGWVSSGEHLVIDGVYGPATEAAVKRFQSGYGLAADGVAGSQTFNKIYDLTSGDCTPAHFTYSEFNDNCGANNFSGGAVSASTAKENTRRVMWQLEAMRHKLGDQAIGITSGFRSYSCNSAVGGSSSSRHLYGETADLGIGANTHSQCTLYHAAWKAGFTEILGPGYPGHNDHVHVANDPSPFRSAPNC